MGQQEVYYCLLLFVNKVAQILWVRWLSGPPTILMKLCHEGRIKESNSLEFGDPICWNLHNLQDTHAAGQE